MELNPKISESKLSLKQALLILMKKKRFHKITIKELCKLADLNRSTFYVNYEDMDGLLFDIHTDFFDGIAHLLGGAKRDSQETGQEEYTGELTEIINYLAANKEIFQLLLSNNEDNLFEKNLLDYYERLFVTEKDTYIERYMFIYHSIGSFSLVRQWLQDEAPCSAEELARLICAMSDSARER